MDGTLLLNASFEPLKVISWERAVTLFFLGKVEVVHVYEREIRSVALTIKMPSVVRLLRYVKLGQRKPPLSRINLFARDNGQCQYCGDALPMKEATIDHVMPRSRGGKRTWENVVLACHPCNRKKGRNTPHEARMYLSQPPHAPDWLPVLSVRIKPQLPPSWLVFLSKNR